MATNSLITKTYNLFSVSKKRDFAKTYIFACQHILRPREKVLSLLIEFGIPKENIFVLGKAYSTNNSLFEELKDAGFNLYQPPLDIKKSFDEQHKKNCNQMFSLFEKTVPRGSRVIILDDGGVLLSEFNRNFETINRGIEILGIEQTSSGFRLLENVTLNFPIINVARSAIKLVKESPFIAEVCLEKLSIYILGNKIVPSRFIVIGLGPVGQALVDVLQKQGEKVFGFDTILGHKNLIEKITKLRPNIIIGATGATAISREDVERLDSLGYPIHLVNVASSDREFPVAAYRQDKNLHIHSDVKYGNIIFVNNGFPINFGTGHFKGGVEKIEKTICLLLGSVLYLANKQESVTLPEEFIKVPKKITNIL